MLKIASSPHSTLSRVKIGVVILAGESDDKAVRRKIPVSVYSLAYLTSCIVATNSGISMRITVPSPGRLSMSK
jgi:hypothetical protein